MEFMQQNCLNIYQMIISILYYKLKLLRKLIIEHSIRPGILSSNPDSRLKYFCVGPHL